MSNRGDSHKILLMRVLFQDHGEVTWGQME